MTIQDYLKPFDDVYCFGKDSEIQVALNGAFNNGAGTFHGLPYKHPAFRMTAMGTFGRTHRELSGGLINDPEFKRIADDNLLDGLWLVDAAAMVVEGHIRDETTEESWEIRIPTVLASLYESVQLKYSEFRKALEARLVHQQR